MENKAASHDLRVSFNQPTSLLATEVIELHYHLSEKTDLWSNFTHDGFQSGWIFFSVNKQLLKLELSENELVSCGRKQPLIYQLVHPEPAVYKHVHHHRWQHTLPTVSSPSEGYDMFNGQAVVCREGGGAEPELKERGRTGGAGGMLTAEQTTATCAAEHRAGPAVKCILMWFVIT